MATVVSVWPLRMRSASRIFDQEPTPGSRATRRVGPSGDLLIAVAGAAVDVAEQELRAGWRFGPEPWCRVDREHDPAPHPRHRTVQEQPRCSPLVDRSLAQGLVDHAITAPETRLQGQMRERVDLADMGEQRVGQLEETVGTGRHARV